MHHQEISLLFQCVCRNWDVKIRSAQISIPLGDFVLENTVIAKRIPSQTGDLPMILVRILSIMGENNIWIDSHFKLFKPRFNRFAILWEESVLKGHDTRHDLVCRLLLEK